jgi:hypothetical protein
VRPSSCGLAQSGAAVHCGLCATSGGLEATERRGAKIVANLLCNFGSASRAATEISLFKVHISAHWRRLALNDIRKDDRVMEYLVRRSTGHRAPGVQPGSGRSSGCLTIRAPAMPTSSGFCTRCRRWHAPTLQQPGSEVVGRLTNLMVSPGARAHCRPRPRLFIWAGAWVFPARRSLGIASGPTSSKLV